MITYLFTAFCYIGQLLQKQTLFQIQMLQAEGKKDKSGWIVDNKFGLLT